MSDFDITARNEVRRYAKRGKYDRATIDPILDEALVCHVGFALDGQPYVIPTIHARMDEQLLVHGLKGGRMLERALEIYLRELEDRRITSQGCQNLVRIANALGNLAVAERAKSRLENVWLVMSCSQEKECLNIVTIFSNSQY
jgi:hypothetical protein